MTKSPGATNANRWTEGFPRKLARLLHALPSMAAKATKAWRLLRAPCKKIFRLFRAVPAQTALRSEGERAMVTADAGRTDKGASQAPARSARPCGAPASRSGGRATAGSSGELELRLRPTESARP